MIWEQQGYRKTIVNGEVVIDDGDAHRCRPGAVLRFNQ